MSIFTICRCQRSIKEYYDSERLLMCNVAEYISKYYRWQVTTTSYVHKSYEFTLRVVHVHIIYFIREYICTYCSPFRELLLHTNYIHICMLYVLKRPVRSVSSIVQIRIAFRKVHGCAPLNAKFSHFITKAKILYKNAKKRPSSMARSVLIQCKLLTHNSHNLIGV